MKNAYLLLFGLLLFSLLSSGQDGRIRMRFLGTASNGRVFLDWTMNFGETCNGIDITRSADSLNFTRIGGIQGICGSPTDTVSYSFLDESPLPNKTNYYRLSLGNLGLSQVIAVDVIDLKGKNSQVRPNPITNLGRIYFSNERKRNHTLEIISPDGQIQNRISGREEFFTLNASLLKQGPYIFRILDEDNQQVSTGRFVINK